MSKHSKADESGLVSAAPARAVAHKGKLEKKKHHRLPRKQKKALKELNAAGQA